MTKEQIDASLDQFEAMLRDLLDQLLSFRPQMRQWVNMTESQRLRFLSIMANFGEQMGHANNLQRMREIVEEDDE